MIRKWRIRNRGIRSPKIWSQIIKSRRNRSKKLRKTLVESETGVYMEKIIKSRIIRIKKLKVIIT